MRIRTVTVGAAHKISIPGLYESINPSVSITADIEEGEDLTTVVNQLKAQVEAEFWRLAYTDFATALERAQAGTQNWLVAKFPQAT